MAADTNIPEMIFRFRMASVDNMEQAETLRQDAEHFADAVRKLLEALDELEDGRVYGVFEKMGVIL